jgi:hypothetical protein
MKNDYNNRANRLLLLRQSEWRVMQIQSGLHGVMAAGRLALHQPRQFFCRTQVLLVAVQTTGQQYDRVYTQSQPTSRYFIGKVYHHQHSCET